MRGLLVVFLFNAMSRHHKGHLIAAGKVIEAMDDEQRRAYGLTGYEARHIEDHLYRFTRWLVETFRAAPEVELGGDVVRLDAFTFLNRLVLASTVTDLAHPSFHAIAVDDTAVESFAALYGDPETAEIVQDDDGVVDDRPDHLKGRPKIKQQLKVYGVDEIGRKQYSEWDEDARMSYATATNSRGGHHFFGYHFFLAVGTRRVAGTKRTDEIKLGSSVPELVLGANLAPGGDHRGEAILSMLAHVRKHWPNVEDVVLDWGYVKSKPHRFFYPTRKLGYHITLEPKLHQRGIRPYKGNALLIDGGFYSPLMPKRLWGIDEHGNNQPLTHSDWRAKLEVRLAETKPFNERAQYAFIPHGRPDEDGSRRMRCPFCAGRLRSPQVPHSMRWGDDVPLVHLEGGEQSCCSTPGGGTITVSAEDAVWWQRFSFGSSAWWLSYGRKNSAESANSALQSQFIDVSKYTQLMGVEKITLMLAFALAGYNLSVLDAWAIQLQLEADGKQRRKKRREGTWYPEPPEGEPDS